VCIIKENQIVKEAEAKANQLALSINQIESEEKSDLKESKAVEKNNLANRILMNDFGSELVLVENKYFSVDNLSNDTAKKTYSK